MANLPQFDWVALAVCLIGHYYALYIVSAWTKKNFRDKYEMSRELIRSFFSPPGWAVQPLLFIISGFLTASIFLFWQRNYESSSDTNFSLVMGFHFASVFLLQLWSTSASWGEKWWWFTVADSVLLTATSTVVWAIMGVETAWLPFGLYAILPIMAFLSIGVAAGFAVDASLITIGALASAARAGANRLTGGRVRAFRTTQDDGTEPMMEPAKSGFRRSKATVYRY